VEGSNQDGRAAPDTNWLEYEFKGKPSDPTRRPPWVAPYHLRLDWLMWFEAMAPAPHSRWVINLLAGLLQNHARTLSLLGTNPFPDAPPRYLRALHYRYRVTTAEERRRTGLWWQRELVGPFYGPVTLTRR